LQRYKPDPADAVEATATAEQVRFLHAGFNVGLRHQGVSITCSGHCLTHMLLSQRFKPDVADAVEATAAAGQGGRGLVGLAQTAVHPPPRAGRGAHAPAALTAEAAAVIWTGLGHLSVLPGVFANEFACNVVCAVVARPGGGGRWYK
jgi:hypothetical protein